MQFSIPNEIYTSDKACGEFILNINERLSKLSAMEKMLKEAKEVANRRHARPLGGDWAEAFRL